MRWMIIAVGFVLSGCASGPTWYKDGATQASFDADKAECRYEAIKNGGSFDPSFGKSYAVAMHRDEITIACLRHKGYSQEAQAYAKQEPFKPVPVELNYKFNK